MSRVNLGARGISITPIPSAGSGQAQGQGLFIFHFTLIFMLALRLSKSGSTGSPRTERRSAATMKRSWLRTGSSLPRSRGKGLLGRSYAHFCRKEARGTVVYACLRMFISRLRYRGNYEESAARDTYRFSAGKSGDDTLAIIHYYRRRGAAKRCGVPRRTP